jgi:hypothetical protein
VSNEKAFLDAVHRSSHSLSDDARKELSQRIRQSRRRCTELDSLIQALYEGNVLGTVTDKQFEQRSKEYEAEQMKLEEEIALTEELLSGWNAVRKDGQQFVALAKRFLSFPALTGEIVSTFLDRILVHETDKSTGEPVQEVEIWFRFIGRFDPTSLMEGGERL